MRFDLRIPKRPRSILPREDELLDDMRPDGWPDPPNKRFEWQPPEPYGGKRFSDEEEKLFRLTGDWKGVAMEQ